MMGRNANFSGKGFAENTFNVTAMPQAEFDEWVEEVKANCDPLTEEKFDELLEPGHFGQMTFTGTHLEFSPAPEHEHGSIHAKEDEDHSTDDHTDHSNH